MAVPGADGGKGEENQRREEKKIHRGYQLEPEVYNLEVGRSRIAVKYVPSGVAPE